MPEHRSAWKNHQIREQIQVLDHEQAPTVLLKNAFILNSYIKQWIRGNVWIYGDRIVYIGEELPKNTTQTEIMDCEGLYLVPGYIEPHAHPFQLYNPQTLARYAAQHGTTTMISDNLNLLFQNDKKKALTLLRKCKEEPFHHFWWARFDLQSEVKGEDLILSPDCVSSWLDHDCVLQGGELTGWPSLLAGDDLMLDRIQEAKKKRKRVEGHFPGASERTLTKMKLFGIDGDHEAMTGKEVYTRLLAGYTVALRHSSIRPDLPKLLKEIKEIPISSYEHLFFTTDGATPAFYQEGVTNPLIEMALSEGFDPIEVYHMASFNIARYYGIDHMLGSVTAGRFATLNFLTDPCKPNPVHVMAKGKWLKREGVNVQKDVHELPWKECGFSPLQMNWGLTMDDLQFSMPLGLQMVNGVILKPYSISRDLATDELSADHDESFLALIDRNGNWRINTVLKGFGGVKGMASSFSATGDLLLIGKSKADMVAAWKQMVEIGGGIVICEDGRIVFELPLELSGTASKAELPELMEKYREFHGCLKERGYAFEDPVYTLFFLSSTHLPFVRITPRGIFDVKKKTILFPSIMR
ncbi:adenine deaminase [Bacillus sp. FJAT-42376]|uniref:adenine deaminase C-terminal domain-containing protein n=1 Tax=Bacillus sp. FJAT-42376 TaxID=2014076 RepID=UPI000F5130DA|nr:adenine deaminase C-terminal domain-containing protein [Bacillus sp. FJAT-42376]AZB41474.1 adenine deaminase [Bacillus sp. FJAT-42376]